jgi:N-acetylneuraminic acid mutarotase
MALCEPLESRRLLAATRWRIDAGGDGLTDSSGKVWRADTNVTAGVAAGGGDSVAGTSDDALFSTRRSGDFAYSLPIKSGTYKVKFLFMEPTHTAAGQRVFDVIAERKTILNNFDITAVSGKLTAVVKTANVIVSDGRLNLWFQTEKDASMVSAIEVIPFIPTINWKELAAAPLPRFEGQGEVVGDKLYLFGGFTNDSIKTTDRADVFDAATGTWTRLANVPQPQTHSGSASDGTDIYLAGGYVGDWKGASTPVSRKVFKYDTLTNTWTSMLSLPAPRAAGALVRVGRKLHFFGGMDEQTRDRGEHWTLDLRRPTRWIVDAPMPNPRNHLGYALMGGKIYAIGGQHRLNETTGNDAEVDAFDVVTGVWTRVADLPQPRSHTHNSTFVMGGNRLVIAGGSGPQRAALTDLLEYDAINNRWTTIGAMPAPRSAAVVKLLGDYIIATGGTTTEISPTTDTWISQ